jgi:hypothetical protein
MKTSHRRGVSNQRMEQFWTLMKTWIDRAKAFDYLLHPLRVDVLTLLIFSLKMPAGWIALGWLVAVYLFMKLREKESPRPRRKRVAKVRDHKKCKPPTPKSRRDTRQKRAKLQRKED